MLADLKGQELRTGEWLTHITLGLCQFIHFDNEDCTTCTIDIHGMWHRGEQLSDLRRADVFGQGVNLDRLSQEIHQNNIDKGFFDEGTEKNFGEIVALIHSEASEALECDRIGKKTPLTVVNNGDDISPAALVLGIEDDETFKEQHRAMIKDHTQAELVDVIIRSLDALRWMNTDIDNTMACVMRYNKLRPPKHGKLY